MMAFESYFPLLVKELVLNTENKCNLHDTGAIIWNHLSMRPPLSKRVLHCPEALVVPYCLAEQFAIVSKVTSVPCVKKDWDTLV
ncbi:hypothetical protein H671_1g0180 [Cricetulus griseus]|nr:hypothetical protein H671_1g0180 [Cricetulus griseus]